jgi:predicted MFS family arabinose efflux permease
MAAGKQPYTPGQLSSYLRLLRSNTNYRRYWIASCISQIGDWFNYIAIFVVLHELTGSGKAVSWFLIAKHLAPALFGPVAGIVADRYHRKTILLACDLLRAGLVLAYLAIRDPSQVWLIYVLAFTQEALWTFSSPARQASLPNLCSKEELSIVNGLSGASWSVMLALGAALGGFFTAHMGWEMAIIADSCSFLLSALILVGVIFPPAALQKKRDFSLARLTGWQDLHEGYAYLRTQPKILSLLWVKSAWALSGGILVLLTVFGEQVLAGSGGRQGEGSGILFAMRGVGAALGPLLAWRLVGESNQAMQKAIGWAFFVSCAAYLLFSQANTLVLAALWICLGYISGSVQWVFSTTLIHRLAQDSFRGRIFSTEMTLLTLVLTLSIWLTGQALEWGLDPRTLVLIHALILILPGLAWLHSLKKHPSPCEGEGAE